MLGILINTIFPIFSIILLGYWLRIKRIIPPEYSKPANQIVYNVAIPAMIFSEIAQVPFKANFNLKAVLSLLGALGIMVLAGLVLIRFMKIPEGRRGTFLHSTFHGNIGYLSYAIAFYALGESSFARMAILSSFLIIGQNLLAVWALTTFSTVQPSEEQKGVLWEHILLNPIIVSVVLGIPFSVMEFSLPAPIQKSLTILSGMAFPTALLLIGSSLSFGTARLMVREIVSIGLMKMLGLPLLGYALMAAIDVPEPLLLPGVILLASPPATVTYVMAIELGGDPELAATSISILTLLSAFSYSMVLSSLA